MNRIQRVKSGFAKLSQAEKVIFIGAALTLLSLFLPWYHDLDAWGKGDTYLGITGPLSIIGLVILLGTGCVFAKTGSKMLGRRVRSLEKFKDLSLYVAAENILLFVVTTSIYFDPKFGVNITLKETAFGLFLCLIGSITISIGGYMKRQEPAKPELNVFEEVEQNIERIHKDLVQDEITLAEKQYREINNSEGMTEKRGNETLRMDL